jgi:hypothetical protein
MGNLLTFSFSAMKGTLLNEGFLVASQVVRVTFSREVSDERDAISTLTMLAQVAWERERNYIPVMPTVADPVPN